MVANKVTLVWIKTITLFLKYILCLLSLHVLQLFWRVRDTRCVVTASEASYVIVLLGRYSNERETETETF